MHIVIIAGGIGSRLWPVSRQDHPKPFIRLNDGMSLLQKTYQRAQQLGQLQSVTMVTNRELFFRTEDELRKLKPAQPLHYLLEPFGRNTAPAISLAALEIQQRYGPEASILVLPADHLIQDQPAFSEAVGHAAEAAAQGYLVTFGIQPDRPETGYGYIEQSNESLSPHAYRVKRFVEKPALAQAKRYLTSGHYLWNAGMFCFQAATLLEDMQQHAHELYQQAKLALSTAQCSQGNGHTITRFAPEPFQALDDIAIDYALMEKSQRVAVIPCQMGWSDIGTWKAMAELTPPDPDGNRLQGNVELDATHNCYIHSPHRLTAAIGLDDLIIVDTADALLVAHQHNCQDVKQLLERIKQNGSKLHQHHVTVYRPWGTYTVLEESENFKIKRIEVTPGASLSLQMHCHRSEHWIVVSGTAKVINADQQLLLRTNESTYIPAGNKHRLENPGVLPLIMIEVQSGQYLGEDDIQRFTDHYGRT